MQRPTTKPICTFLWAAALAFTALPITATANEEATPKIEWRQDLQNALKAPTPHEKPLLLRFFAKWCGPCRVMDARVWPDAKVAKAVHDAYTPIEIDIDTLGAAEIARQYGVHAVPTIILLDHKGSERIRANFMSTEQLLAFLD